MDMSDIKAILNQKLTFDLDIVKTKPLYSKKTFVWELESIESVMTDGVQRAIFCEFEIGHGSFSYTNGNGTSNSCSGSVPHSKWRLHLDLADIEPAITVEKLSPTDKVIYYRMSARAMRSPKEETDVISYPQWDLFYEAVNTNERKVAAGQQRKFTLHKQHDYGCSYTSWFKDVLTSDSLSLLLKVDFETCESSSVYSFSV